MARKAISFNGYTHERIRLYCKEQGISMSAFLEQIIAEKLDAAGAPIPEAVQPPTSSKTRKVQLSDNQIQDIADEHFTF